jgi:hypothetical protein
MLKVTRRGKVEDLRDVSVQEDRALREPGARLLEAAVVIAHQRVGAGNWFYVTCL